MTRNTCLRQVIDDRAKCNEVSQCYASDPAGLDLTALTTTLSLKESQHHDPILARAWNFGPSFATKEGSVCYATLLCLGWRAGQKANKSNHTHTKHTKHTALQNEDNHKQRRRCRYLADGGFINVSSMNWSGVLSVGRWDKSGSSYTKVQTLPIASDGHAWVMQQRTVVKTGTAETKNMVVPGYTHRVGTGILCSGPRVPLHSADIW